MKPQHVETGVMVAESQKELEAKVDVPTLLRLRDQMKQQLTECSAAVHASQGNYSEMTEEKFLKSATEDLEQDIEDIKGSFKNKTLALQRIQLGVALKNKIKQNDDDSRLIMGTMKQIIKLSNAIIEYQRRTRKKEEKLIDMKRKRLSLKKSEGEKLQQIHTMMKKQKEEQASMEDSEALERTRNTLKKEGDITTIIQNVFQNVIIGSRVNWAEDPSLKEIVLQLEKDVCFP